MPRWDGDQATGVGGLEAAQRMSRRRCLGQHGIPVSVSSWLLDGF